MYELYITGGSLGEIEKGRKVVYANNKTYRYKKTFKTRKEAQIFGKKYVDSFDGGYESYYMPGYITRKKKK